MRLALVTLLLAGCLGDAEKPQDMAVHLDLPAVMDLSGADYTGFKNCVQLNMCISDPMCINTLCQNACHASATPSANTLDQALQDCLRTNCPDNAGAICAPDANGNRSATCKQCITNAEAAQNATCTPSDAAECHACLMQTIACVQDK